MSKQQDRGYSSDMNKQKLAFARNLKRNPTRGERTLNRMMWIAGYKAQSYDPTGFLPDYYASYFRVALEVDGSVHRGAQKRHDKYKDQVRGKNHVYTLRVSDDYAYWFPLLVLAEAWLTGIMYLMYTKVRRRLT